MTKTLRVTKRTKSAEAPGPETIKATRATKTITATKALGPRTTKLIKAQRIRIQ